MATKLDVKWARETKDIEALILEIQRLESQVSHLEASRERLKKALKYISDFRWSGSQAGDVIEGLGNEAREALAIDEKEFSK